MSNKTELSKEAKKVLDLMEIGNGSQADPVNSFDASYDKLFQPWNTTREQSRGGAHVPVRD